MVEKRNTLDNEANDEKKFKSEFSKDEIRLFFSSKIWAQSFQTELQKKIECSRPYRWGSIEHLMDDSLLREVRNEFLNEIAFTPKETDIYKVNQSGDLANLSGLDWNDLSRLPSLYKLRAAIYSAQFRDLISRVTGCGKLSGTKTDMSINIYTSGCHLLPHDDVIGSRRLSFILYLPEPDKVWKESYGGALRLFPSMVPNVPHTDIECKLVPQFNQIAFFTVQPGLSFHDVEEVRANKQRISIQGWFHIPQEGEEGYIPGEQEKTEAQSTLQQLQSKELQEFDFPKFTRLSFLAEEQKLHANTSHDLAEDEIEYLSSFVNPLYLKSDYIQKLRDQFTEDCVLDIADILNEEKAKALKDAIEETEIDEKSPSNSKEVTFPWKCSIPPHKHRYMYLDGTANFDLTERGVHHSNKIGTREPPNFELVHKLSKRRSDTTLTELASFLRSITFRKWVRLVCGLVPTSDQVMARRFRPGQDYILATPTGKNLARPNTNDLDALLEATFHLTPSASTPKNWALGEYGGYELCVAMNDPDDEDDKEDDPAVYRAADPEDDSVLYSSQCKWNSLCLMLRDPSVMKFVKYVSINAKGSRWDMFCQWNVQSGESDEE